MQAIFTYITCETEAQARLITEGLLQERLIACANILPGITSLYHWEGKLIESKEVVLIAKTTASRLQEVIDKAKSLHTYECPCIVALPVVAGAGSFLRWVDEETTL